MIVPRLPRRLDLLPIGEVGEGLGKGWLEWLGAELDPCFGTSSVPGPSVPLREEWIDGERAQGRSNAIVDALSARIERGGADPRTHWVLGVLEIDLYAPGRPYVFGEATVGGGCAVISLARLRPEALSEPSDLALFRHRVLKEALHELGHVAGLAHCGEFCGEFACVMAESPNVQDVDRKGNEFCSGCRLALHDLLAKKRDLI